METTKEAKKENAPLKVFRSAGVSSSIFRNKSVDKETGKERIFLSAKIQRSYRDGDEWKTSDSFTSYDLPHLLSVVLATNDYFLSNQ